MTASGTGFDTPPGGQRRAVSRFRPGIGRAVVAEIVAIALTVATWTGLHAFYDSLRVGDPGPQIAFAITMLLAVTVLIVPAYGGRAIARSLRARRLAADGRRLDAAPQPRIRATTSST